MPAQRLPHQAPVHAGALAVSPVWECCTDEPVVLLCKESLEHVPMQGVTILLGYKCCSAHALLVQKR